MLSTIVALSLVASTSAFTSSRAIIAAPRTTLKANIVETAVRVVYLPTPTERTKLRKFGLFTWQ